MSELIGIDLGTTNSMAAWVSESGAEVIEDENLSSWQASVVCYAEEKFIVGSEAVAKRLDYPQSTFFSFKPFMGKKYKDLKAEQKNLPYQISEGDRGQILLGEEKFTPEQLSAEVLKKVKAIAEIILKQKIERAVITVPAYFDEVQRLATTQSAKIAQIEVVRIINEPTAAAIAYGIGETPITENNQTIENNQATENNQTIENNQATENNQAIENNQATENNQAIEKKQGRVAIYDLGGGTFDVSILELKNKIFRVLSTNGNSHLGGDDFDQLLIDFIEQKFFMDKNSKKQSSPVLKSYLKKKAEQLKIQLSNHLEASIPLQVGQETIDFTIKQKEFTKIISPLLEKTKEHTKIALRDANLKTEEIKDIILVGGSTRVPAVRKLATEIFGKSPRMRIDPDRVVAIGAAIQANLLAGKRRDFLLVDVIPLSLGIETLDGVFSKLILKNSSIPTKAMETFSTQKDGQTSVAINIYQGERELVKDCRFLGQAILRGIPNMPAGLPRIEVEFLVDANGLLKVSAKELRSGVEVEIEVIPDQGLRQQEIDGMIESSIVNAEQDFLQSRLQEFRFQAESILKALEKSWTLAADFFEEQTLQKVQAQKEKLKIALKQDNPLKIKEAADKLGNLTADFANYVMEVSIKNHSNL